MKVFIIGALEKLSSSDIGAFDQAEKELREAGYSVFNPARMDPKFDEEWRKNEICSVYIHILLMCDAVFELAVSRPDDMAILEVACAKQSGKKFVHKNRDGTFFLRGGKKNA